MNEMPTLDFDTYQKGGSYLLDALNEMVRADSRFSDSTTMIPMLISFTSMVVVTSAQATVKNATEVDVLARALGRELERQIRTHLMLRLLENAEPEGAPN